MNEKILDKLNKHFSGSKTESYSKGKILIFANHEPEGVSFLLDGIIEQYDITPEGNKITVNVFKPPAFFPMSWAINKTPNTYFYATLTDVKLKRAEAEGTVDFLKGNPDVMLDLLSRVYKGTDALLRRLVFAASGIAANRLIFELLIEANRFGVVNSDGTVSVKIKQGVLADRCGLARETISRELHKLETDNIVLRNNKDIQIDIKRMEAKLNFTV
jgi:CRP/FNR family transcriptional regulator, anaerobic regulatory protein